MAKYKLLGTDESNGVLNTESGAFIPNDNLNKDWKEYENWKLGLDASGNVLDGNPGVQTPDPQYTLVELKDAKKAELKQACKVFIESGYVVNLDLGEGAKDYRYDSELKDQINILGATQLDSGIFPIDFSCVDVATNTKGRHSHSAANIDLIYTTGVSIIQTAKAALYSLYTTVDNAADATAVNAIVWVDV